MGLDLHHKRFFHSSYRVCPQGSDYFGQRQLPKLLHVSSVDQTLCGVKDMILNNKEAMEGEKHRLQNQQYFLTCKYMALLPTADRLNHIVCLEKKLNLKFNKFVKNKHFAALN